MFGVSRDVGGNRIRIDSRYIGDPDDICGSRESRGFLGVWNIRCTGIASHTRDIWDYRYIGDARRGSNSRWNNYVIVIGDTIFGLEIVLSEVIQEKFLFLFIKWLSK